jgi:hypothetical protein
MSGLLQSTSNFSDNRLTFSVSAGIRKAWICVAFFTAIWVTFFSPYLKIGVATGYVLNGLGIVVWFPTGAKDFSSPRFQTCSYAYAASSVLGPMTRIQIPGRSNICFSSPQCLDRLWGPLELWRGQYRDNVVLALFILKIIRNILRLPFHLCNYACNVTHALVACVRATVCKRRGMRKMGAQGVDAR